MESFKQLNSTFWPPHGPASTGFGVPKPRRHRFLSHSLRGVLNDSSGISDQLHQIVVKSLTNTCSTHKLIARERCNIMQDPSGFDWPSALGLGMLGGSGDSGDHWWPLVTTGDHWWFWILFWFVFGSTQVTHCDEGWFQLRPVDWTRESASALKNKTRPVATGRHGGGSKKYKRRLLRSKDVFWYVRILLDISQICFVWIDSCLMASLQFTSIHHVPRTATPSRNGNLTAKADKNRSPKELRSLIAKWVLATPKTLCASGRWWQWLANSLGSNATKSLHDLHVSRWFWEIPIQCSPLYTLGILNNPKDCSRLRLKTLHLPHFIWHKVKGVACSRQCYLAQGRWPQRPWSQLCSNTDSCVSNKHGCIILWYNISIYIYIIYIYIDTFW